MTETSLLVVHDPFCGWCYGAKPLARAVADAGVLPVRFVHRALFTDGHELANSPAMTAKIKQFDARIGEMAGVPFTDIYRSRLLDSPGLVHDSWLTALAVQMVRYEAAQREHDWLDRMQEARFTKGLDLSDKAVLSELLQAFGVTGDLDDPALEAAARAEQKRGIMLCTQYGSGGVPLMLLVEDGQLQPLQHGDFLGRPTEFATALAQFVQQRGG